MKRFLTTALALCLTAGAGAFAQSIDDIGKVSLAVVIPQSDDLSSQNINLLHAKISQIVTSCGLGADGLDNTFIVYPKVAVVDKQVVEGGMRNLTTMTIDFSLFIAQNNASKMTFSTIVKSLKGVGRDNSTAITNAVAKLNPDDPSFGQFIVAGKNKICKYYTQKLPQILAQANALAKRREYEQALSLLMTVPEEIPGYEKVTQKTVQIFKYYMELKGKSDINQAKALLAEKDYDGALDVLAHIDPSTTSFAQAQVLIQQIANKVDEEQKQEIEDQKKMYNDSLELEKSRINAAKEIALAYYQSKNNKSDKDETKNSDKAKDKKDKESNNNDSNDNDSVG